MNFLSFLTLNAYLERHRGPLDPRGHRQRRGAWARNAGRRFAKGGKLASVVDEIVLMHGTQVRLRDDRGEEAGPAFSLD